MLATHTLHTLISITEIEEYIIRKKIHNLHNHKILEETILNDLNKKYQIYQISFEQKKEKGITIFDWQNYSVYIDLLIAKITEQECLVNKFQIFIELEQLQWNEVHKKQLIYGKLNKQQVLEQQKLVNKQEQKQQDEWKSPHHFDKTQTKYL